MLLTPQNIERLKNCEYIVTEKDKVVEILASSDQILFFDTCLMSRVYLNDRIEDILKYIDIAYTDNIVVVFTETLLSELVAYTTGGNVSNKLIQVFQRINEKYKVVYFEEEWLVQWRMQLVEESTIELNQHFKDVFKKYKALLSRIGNYADDNSFSFYPVLFESRNVSDSVTFGEEVINAIKSKKKRKDSLAELLVFFCVLYVMDLYENDYGEFTFFFLTADRKAAARVKDLQNHSEIYLKVFAFYTVGVLAKEMMDSGVLSSDDDVKEFIKQMLKYHTYQDIVKIRVFRKGALDTQEEEITIENLVDLMRNEPDTKIMY